MSQFGILSCLNFSLQVDPSIAFVATNPDFLFVFQYFLLNEIDLGAIETG